jgi:hypothetical protein
MYIGSHEAGGVPSSFFVGHIAEVRIYSGSLIGAIIESNYSSSYYSTYVSASVTTPTPTPTPTDTPTPTALPTATSTPTLTPSSTPAPTETPTPTPTFTPSPTPSSTPTQTSTPTSTPTLEPTSTPTITPTSTPTPTPTPIPKKLNVPIAQYSTDYEFGLGREVITPTNINFEYGQNIILNASQNKYSFDYYEIHAPITIVASDLYYITYRGFTASFDPRTEVKLNINTDVTGSNSPIIAHYR